MKIIEKCLIPLGPEAQRVFNNMPVTEVILPDKNMVISKEISNGKEVITVFFPEKKTVYNAFIIKEGNSYYCLEFFKNNKNHDTRSKALNIRPYKQFKKILEKVLIASKIKA
jgi:hypothetical protein